MSEGSVALAGVAANRCVVSTPPPMADARVRVWVVADACAGPTPENHAHALAVTSLHAPQTTAV